MDEHVTTGQAIIILIATRLSLAISTMSTINLPPYNQDVWFMNLVSVIYTLIMFQPLLFLANRFNNFNLTGYLRIIYGKTLGGIVIILYGIYFLVNSVNGITILTELTSTTILEQEGNMSIIGLMMIVIFYFVTRGLITGARSFQVLSPIALSIIIILILLGIENVDFSILRPILSDSSFIEINKGAVMLPLYFTDSFILFMIIPELQDNRKINKIVIISVVVSIVSLAIIVILTQGALGIEQTRHSNASFFLYTRLIDAFDLFERIDSIFVGSWIITSIGRNTAFVYIATRSFRELFNKGEEDRVILLIISVIVMIISLISANTRSVIGIRKELDLFYGILFVIFVLIIPIITCIVYFFRRKTLRRREPSHKLIDKLE